MKYTLRVPSPTAYAYIEAEFEGTAEEAVREHDRLNKLMLGEFGLDQKEWNKALDLYLSVGTMEADVHELMSKEQKWMIHEIDKSISRQNYKNPSGNKHHSLEDN
jgi:hypothetical protein